MEKYLLIERSKYGVKPITEGDKYTLEGVFTEFDTENRNGRVYAKKEFQPHFDALKKIVESGTCVGELDHPKQFETTLNNVSHKIEDIWMDESNNRVMGRIKLLDTDAGKQAKALVDGGIPLHISSRAAGTVTENKQVKMHKLFTYDLVDTPGFANARLNSVNESFGMLNESAELDEFSDFAIYEVEEGTKKTQDISKVNNKNNYNETMDYINENEFNKYSNFTKEAIESVKSEVKVLKQKSNDMQEIQESIIEQNDSIVDEYSNEDFKSKFKKVDEKLTAILKWADHVKDEFDGIQGVSENKSLSELKSKYDALEEKMDAITKWSQHSTETVSALEDWSNHVTESVTTIEDWSNHVTESVTAIEEGKKETHSTKINESNVEDFKSSIYNKLESILEGTKEQRATDDTSLLNESKSEKIEEKSEQPLWKTLIPSKYKETWNSLSESEKVRISNRAELFNFVNESSIRSFWNNEFTKENLIKEETNKITNAEKVTAINERRQAAIKSYNRLFD